MTGKVTGTELRRFIADVFERVGMSSVDSSTVADVLVWANLRAVDSHGVVRLPRYLEMVDQGVMNVRAEPVLTERTPSCISVEADRAPGAVAMSYAVDQVIKRAKGHGIVMATIGRMTHSGALGFYTQKAAAAGFACIAINAGTPLMPYHGARGAALGTNPISIAVPGGDSDPIVFDMATSAVSQGKLLMARRTGTPFEAGLVVDEQGEPTTDPMVAAMTLPVAGAKGSGLALMIECLASLLCGHPVIAEALEMSGEGRKHRQNALVIAIDISRFVPLDEFVGMVARTVKALKALPLASGSVEVLMPGERGGRAMEERQRNGIPVPLAIMADLEKISARLAVTPIRTLSSTV